MREVSYDFSDETIVVTGGASGIGRALALAFGRAGATVVVADVRTAPKDDDADRPTHQRIEEAGGTAAFVETDVSDPAQVREAVGAAHEFGGVSVMVNNAGLHITESVRTLTEEQFDRIHGVNVKGTFFGTQAAVNDMLDRGAPGCVVNLASISSTLAKPEQIAYESTKGAIRMITRSAALELAETGIRVNAVAPGRITTEFGASSAAEKAQSVRSGEMLKPIPMGRAGRPDDVTGAALFLASDDARYVTGELLHVDGGYRTL